MSEILTFPRIESERNKFLHVFSHSKDKANFNSKEMIRTLVSHFMNPHHTWTQDLLYYMKFQITLGPVLHLASDFLPIRPYSICFLALSSLQQNVKGPFFYQIDGPICTIYSSEIRGLRSTKFTSKMIWNYITHKL